MATEPGTPLPRALNHIGALLCLTHLAAVFRWVTAEDVFELLTSPNEPFAICWPLLDGCAGWRPWSPWTVFGVMGLQAAGSAVGTLLFLFQRAHPARVLLTVLLLIRMGVQLQDYRLSGNYHHIPQLVTAAFLWWPHPQLFLRVLLVGLYVCAASLKLNEEWLTGAVFYYRPDWPRWLLQAGCVAVILMEGLLVFGLLLRGAVFWCAWATLLVFHVVSYVFVGWFYPLEMVLLIGTFVLLLRVPHLPTPFEPPGARAWPSSTWLGVILLAMAQAAPAAFVGDSALTGEGRLTALTMFDARAECHSRVTLHGGPPTLPPPAEQQVWDVRIRCDPLVHRAYIRHVCDHIFPATPGVTMDYRLKSRRSVDTTFVVIMDVKDACHADLSYAPWRHQPWILP